MESLEASKQYVSDATGAIDGAIEQLQASKRDIVVPDDMHPYPFGIDAANLLDVANTIKQAADSLLAAHQLWNEREKCTDCGEPLASTISYVCPSCLEKRDVETR